MSLLWLERVGVRDRKNAQCERVFRDCVQDVIESQYSLEQWLLVLTIGPTVSQRATQNYSTYSLVNKSVGARVF